MGGTVSRPVAAPPDEAAEVVHAGHEEAGEHQGGAGGAGRQEQQQQQHRLHLLNESKGASWILTAKCIWNK